MAKAREAEAAGLPAEWFEALGDESLRDMAGPSVFARGLSYFNEGAVELVRDDGTSAGFEASGSLLYQVELAFEDPGLRTSCTCPHAGDGNFCKHMVAAAMVWRRALGGAEEAPPAARAPSAAGAGLARMAKAAQTRAANQQALRQFLQAQPAPALAQRLWERAQSDRDLMAELKAWAASASAAGDPKALRRAVDELLKVSTRQYLEPREVRAWVGRVDRAATLMREALPVLAAEVRSIVDAAIQRVPGVQDRAYDNPGLADEVIGMLVDVLVAALEAEPPPAAWAEHLLQRMEGPCGCAWRQPRVLQAAGPDVARAYSKRLAERWARADAAAPAGVEPAEGWSDGQWRRADERSQLRGWMIEDLACQGDPLAVFEFMKRTARDVPEHCALIDWCARNGRERDALALAQAAIKRLGKHPRLEALLLEAYERDGWDDEALAIRQQRFDAQPSPDHYGPLIAAAHRAKVDVSALRRAAFATAAAHEQADHQRQLKTAERFGPHWRPRQPQGLNVSWRVGMHMLDGELDAAFALVQPPQVCDQRVLEALADRLPASRDEDAFALLRRCFEYEIDHAKTPYREPLRLLAKALKRLNKQQGKAWLLSVSQTYKAKRTFVAALPAL